MYTYYGSFDSDTDLFIRNEFFFYSSSVFDRVGLIKDQIHTQCIFTTCIFLQFTPFQSKIFFEAYKTVLIIKESYIQNVLLENFKFNKKLIYLVLHS